MTVNVKVNVNVKVSSSSSTDARLDFPLCAEAAADSVARPAVSEAVRFLEEEKGTSAFEAVILTGSFSRGEGSVLLTNPLHRILGDIEFLTIARPPFDYPKLRQEMRRLSSRASRRAREMGYDAKIEFTPAGRSYLERAIRPSIFAYDLVHHGKTVAGDESLLDLPPRFSAAEIPRDDAVRLVMNRMMEIHALGIGRELGPIAEAYLSVKTLLDLAGSVLAFSGRYASRYRERLDALRALGGSPPVCLDELEAAVSLKLRPNERALNARADSLASVLGTAMNVWEWEMSQLVGGKGLRELLDRFLAAEGVVQRMRGWAKYYTHPFRPSHEVAPLGRRIRLLFRASPQRLAYASALLSGAGFADEAASLLPAPAIGQPLPGAVELWSWLVRNN